MNEEKQASSLIVNLEDIPVAEIQNRFGGRHEIIRDVTSGKYLTILAVETNSVVEGGDYATLVSALKEQFGVSGIQTVFGTEIPELQSPTEKFNLHISGHLRIEESLS